MANDKDILNTAEIPYEVRMKYIIEAYRKDKERWAKLEPADEHDMEEMETAVDEKAVMIPQDLNRTPRINWQFIIHNEKWDKEQKFGKILGGYRKSAYLCAEIAKEWIMKLTKEEALKRFKNALNRKKAWEEKFEAKYADVTNLYTTA